MLVTKNQDSCESPPFCIRGPKERAFKPCTARLVTTSPLDPSRWLPPTGIWTKTSLLAICIKEVVCELAILKPPFKFGRGVMDHIEPCNMHTTVHNWAHYDFDRDIRSLLDYIGHLRCYHLRYLDPEWYYMNTCWSRILSSMSLVWCITLTCSCEALRVDLVVICLSIRVFFWIN